MARKITKAAGNVYCQARLRAAKYNEKLQTRAGASEAIPGVTEDSIKKYELDITRPPNDVVALMADAYNAPELISWYCANECPLGRDSREIEQMPTERAIIRVQNATGTLEETLTAFAEIVDDGIIDDDEKEKIKELREQFLEVRRRLDEILAACDKK
jgi:transcriptional regulator with XRE-family HTH domain